MGLAIDDVLAAYWSSLESKHSRRGYLHDWKCYQEWLSVRQIEMLIAKPSDIQRYVTQLRDASKAKSTRARALSVIRSVYDHLVVNDFLAFNPARSVKNLKVDTTPTTPFLREAAATRLLAVLEQDVAGDWRARRDRICVLLFIGTGWRRAEVARVRVEDIIDGTLTGIVKGGKPATVALPLWLQSELTAWLTNSKAGPVLPRMPGDVESISDSKAYEIVKALAARAGFASGEVTPHGLRRTFATIARQKGRSLKDVQRALAHASSATTERYDRGLEMEAPGEVFADMVSNEVDRVCQKVNGGLWSLELLMRITCSSGIRLRGWPEDDLCFIDMLAAGAVQAKIETIESALALSVADFPTGGGAGEGHEYLKRLAAGWLRQRGAKKVADEVPLVHGLSDVWSEDLNVAVECGDLEAIRIADGLAFGYSEFVVLPSGFKRRAAHTAIVFVGDDRKLAEFAAAGAFKEYLCEAIYSRTGRIETKTSSKYDRRRRGTGVADRVAEARKKKGP